MESEKEKCRAGLLYDANHDPQLLKERARAQELCQALNGLPPSQAATRKDLLAKLLGCMGEGADIVTPFFCDYGYNISIGPWSFINAYCTILDEAPVTFGAHVFVGPNCGFYTAAHPIDAEQRNKGLEFAKPISIGHSVWLGGHVVVLPGVTIGAESIIGAGSVVTRDVPPGVVAAGNPCRVQRKL